VDPHPHAQARPAQARHRSTDVPEAHDADGAARELDAGVRRLLGVSAGALQTTGWQEPLLNRAKRKSFTELYKGIDELRRKYGEDAVGAATPRNKTG